MYGIVDGSQELILSTVKPLRKDSINVVTGGRDENWDILKKKGYKVTRLIVREFIKIS